MSVSRRWLSCARGAYLLARGLKGVVARNDDRANVEGAFDVADAAIALGLDRLMLERLGQDPHVSALMAARYGLDYVFSKDALAKCKPGSLGGVLFSTMAAGYDPDFYRRVSPSGEMTDYEWASHRGRQIHDLLHLVTGYPPTALGEIGVFAFLAGNALDYGCFFIASAALIGRLLLRPKFLATEVSVFARAWLAGRDAPAMLGVRFEERFDEDLFDLRVSLGIPRHGLSSVDFPEKLLKGYTFRELDGSAAVPRIALAAARRGMRANAAA